MEQRNLPISPSSPLPSAATGYLSSRKRGRAPESRVGDVHTAVLVTLPSVCRDCQLVSNEKKQTYHSKALSQSPPPHHTPSQGSEGNAKSNKKKARSSPPPPTLLTNSDNETFRFAPKSLVPVPCGMGAMFALFQADFDRMKAAGFTVETDDADGCSGSPASAPARADIASPVCKVTKAVGICRARFEELDRMDAGERGMQADFKEFEACEPWVKKEGFSFSDGSLQRVVTVIQPLPHGSINCFWEGPSSRLGTAQYPSRGVREQMWWEHCHGYFADFSFSIQNYKKDGKTLVTSPRAEWQKLAYRNCGKCMEGKRGEYCMCTEKKDLKPADDAVRDHVMLSSSGEEVPRRSPGCWFSNEQLSELLQGKKGAKRCAFEFLRKCAVAKCPEKLFNEIAQQFNANLTIGEQEQHKLTTDEVLAVMLYSGPMYSVYNGLLSRSKFPLDENAWNYHNQHKSTFNQSKHSFITTIAVLLSALRKVSLTTRLPHDRVLYRGTSGRLHLPDCFWGLSGGCTSETNSVRGYTEFGFQSFTRDRDVAIMYSGVFETPSRPFPAILKFKAGAIDRGADVSLISQYPQEVEFLIPPFSFISPDFDHPEEVKFFSCQKEGAPPMLLHNVHYAEIPVRVNVNSRSPTILELQLRNRIQHLQTFKEKLRFLPGQLDATWRDLVKNKDTFAPHLEDSTVHDFISYIVLQCKQQRRLHKNLEKNNFADHQFAHQMSLDMLNCLQWGHDKLKLWLCRGTFFSSMTQHAQAALVEEAQRKTLPKSRRGAPGFVQDWWTLRRCHRMWLAHVRRQIKSLGQPSPLTAETLTRYSRELLVAKGRRLPWEPMYGRSRFNTDNELLVVEAGADGWDAEDIDALAACENAVAVAADLKSWADAIKRSEDECDDVTGMTGLLKACESGNEATVEHLLSYGANVEKQCNSGATPLFYAAANGHPRIIALLHTKRANLNAQVPAVAASVSARRIIAGQTPLCIAAKFGHTECVRCLLELRADPHIKNSQGLTALDIAMQDSSGQAEKLPQWSETPRVHQFKKCVGLLQDAMRLNQIYGGGAELDVMDAFVQSC